MVFSDPHTLVDLVFNDWDQFLLYFHLETTRETVMVMLKAS